MRTSPLTLVLALLAARVVIAQETPPVAPEPEPEPGRLMRPGNLDVRGTLDTDILLIYVDVGAGVDFGVLPAGPGTVSIGAEFDFGFCASACVLLNALTPLTWGSRYYSPFARIGYHFPLKGNATMQKVDVYGLAMVGLVYTNTGASTDDGSISFTGEDTAIGVGAGGGVNYFLGDSLFVGAEARLRYATGIYTFTMKAGQYTFSDRESRWDLSGLNLLLFLGARL